MKKLQKWSPRAAQTRNERCNQRYQSSTGPAPARSKVS